MRLEDARALHDEIPVIDLHADTAKLMAHFGYDLAVRHDKLLPRFASFVGHVDIPRMREGGLGGQFFGLWTRPVLRRGLAGAVHVQLDALDAQIAASTSDLVRAVSAEDVLAARAAGKIAALAGIEGAQALEGKLANVEAFAARGVRYIGLLHFSKNELGSPAYGLGSGGAGLTDFGREVIAEMDRLGVLVDLAHINRAGFFDAMATATRPVMVTHTGVNGKCEHWRNLADDQIVAVADSGGCVGVIFAPRYLGGPGIAAVADHILHIIDVAGEDTPALGSDFDGFVRPPRELADVSMLPALTAHLAERGLGRVTLEKILGKNVLRVLDAVPFAFSAPP